MSIINQSYSKIIQNCIKNALNSEIRLKKVNNYVDFINYLDDFLLKIVKQSIVNTFESIDQDFKHSKRRKERYYTKGKYCRTIMTLFGEIQFEREYYVPKNRNTDGFFYVDNLFSLPKRDYYDPMIKAYIVENSGKYSYIQTGEIIGDKIGKRFKTLKESVLSNISRQTVYNVIKHAELTDIHSSKGISVDTLYVQLDEKWVHTQYNNQKMKEIKAAVVYTGIKKEYKHRNKLVNRQIITSDQSATDLRNKLLDYISQTYNTDHLKTIVISGDGANWIKNSKIYLSIQKHIKTLFVLDRFHLNQAINHISKDETIKYYLRDYLTAYHTASFKQLCHYLIKENPDRKDIIEKKRDYITSNWSYIKNQTDPLFKGCSMEGHISHVLAALFTSRPKAHSLHMISKRLKIREHIVNQLDIKNSYLSNNNLSSKDNGLVDQNTRYPLSLFDVIGHRVRPLYKMFKDIAHGSYIFS